MPNLMTNHAQASEWADRVISANRSKGNFGKFNTGVAWTEEGDPLKDQGISMTPNDLVTEINTFGQPLLLNHDPGKPIGKVVAAEIFEADDGKKFVGVVLGYYDGAKHSAFSDFDFDFSANPGAPSKLPELGDDHWIGIAVDPREVDARWVNEAAEGAPLRVRKRPLSHNAAESAAEVVRILLPYVALVWNPFVTAIATKAGEDTYQAMRKWLDRLFRKFSERKNPIIILQTSVDNCVVSFIARGNNVDTLLAASGTLESAASQAYHLIQALRRQNAPAEALFYEFDPERKAWIPSYAELLDGRLVTDNRSLILAENLPTGLSLGLGGPAEDN